MPLCMTRRSTSSARTDDLRFAVRVKFAVPSHGLGADADRLHEWLQDHVGAGRFAVHSASMTGGSAVAVHLAKPSDAVRLVRAFPQLVLANG